MPLHPRCTRALPESRRICGHDCPTRKRNTKPYKPSFGCLTENGRPTSKPGRSLTRFNFGLVMLDLEAPSWHLTVHEDSRNQHYCFLKRLRIYEMCVNSEKD